MVRYNGLSIIEKRKIKRKNTESRRTEFEVHVGKNYGLFNSFGFMVGKISCNLMRLNVNLRD